MFSSRAGVELTPNRLTRVLNDLRDRQVTYLDLTESNPTRAGFDYPADLLRGLAGTESLTYRPEPFGLLSAREAVCRDLARRGVSARPDRVVLTASTSEAYSFLFKLLCEPGDRVLVPRPSYPLFEHLSRLDGVVPVAYDLERQKRWAIDFDGLEQAIDARTRAILTVSPNNPTGSVLSADEHDRMATIAAKESLALVGDEVFIDYGLDSSSPGSILQHAGAGALTFGLGGLSKSAGLPQIKLAWIIVEGPTALVDAALLRLGVIADAYPSLSGGSCCRSGRRSASSSPSGSTPEVEKAILGSIRRCEPWVYAIWTLVLVAAFLGVVKPGSTAF